MARTPNRDVLAARSIVFSEALCTAPQCSPSRATLLTGLYPHQSGVETNLDAVFAQELSPTIPTFGSRLRAAGYQTAYFGKWHLSAAGPGSHGFDVVGPAQGDDRIAAAAADWLAARPPQPWCAAVSFLNPHDIYRLSADPSYPIRPDATLPANWQDDLSTKPRAQTTYLREDQGKPFANATAEHWLRYRSAYADLLGHVDRNLGGVLQGLKRAGAVDNTVVILTSDHGDLVGSHGLPFKGPCLYDELLHVPLLLSWPGYEASEHCELVSLIDLVPTMLDAAGLPPDVKLPGHSLRALLDGEGSQWPDWAVMEYLAKQGWANPIRGLRQGQWQYNEYLWGGEELYDRLADPVELHNLADDPAHRAQADGLRKQLEYWRRANADRRWEDERPDGV
jgi:arylsulfatase A-like enzyme